MLVYGVILMVGAATGSGSLLRPLQALSISGGAGGQSSHQGLQFKRIKGTEGLAEALRMASANGQPVMLDYYADWCVSCKEMEAFTFTDAAVQAALSNTVLLQTDVTANDARDQQLLKQFGLFGPPAILFFDADGVEQRHSRVVGFMNADEFAAVVRRAIGSAAQPVRNNQPSIKRGA